MASRNGVAYSVNGGMSFEYRNQGLNAAVAGPLLATDDAVYAAMPVGFADIFRRLGSEFTPLDFLQSLPATTRTRRLTSLAAAAGDSNQIFAINDNWELIRTFDRGAHWTPPHPDFCQ
jgi:hypothetical protein